MNDVLVMKRHLMEIIYHPEPDKSDDEKKQFIKKNLTTAKIIAVDIYRCILDVQINVWIS